MVNWLKQLLALITSLTQLTVTVPAQLSLAVTRLVLGAGTSRAHGTFTGAGQVMIGGVVSLTVIVWVQVALLPHTSVALYVRVMVNWLKQLLALITSLTQLTVTVPAQLSLAVTRLVLGAGTSRAHGTFTGAGQVMIGGVVSLTVIAWVQVALLPHTSVALYVRVMVNWLKQLLVLITSLTQLTVTVPAQLSLAVTRLVLGAGTSAAHCTFTGAGQVIVGAVVSLTEMVWVQVALLVEASLTV